MVHFRRCGSETPQGGKGGSGGDGGKLYWRGTILISPIPPIYAVATLSHTAATPPPHAAATQWHPPPAGRHLPWGGGAKRTFFREARKKYPDLPILTSIDVKPLL